MVSIDALLEYLGINEDDMETASFRECFRKLKESLRFSVLWQSDKSDSRYRDNEPDRCVGYILLKDGNKVYDSRSPSAVEDATMISITTACLEYVCKSEINDYLFCNEFQRIPSRDVLPDIMLNRFVCFLGKQNKVRHPTSPLETIDTIEVWEVGNVVSQEPVHGAVITAIRSAAFGILKTAPKTRTKSERLVVHYPDTAMDSDAVVTAIQYNAVLKRRYRVAEFYRDYGKGLLPTTIDSETLLLHCKMKGASHVKSEVLETVYR